MAIIKKINNVSPKIAKNCFLADNSVVIGDVSLQKNCTIWFNTILRGDVNSIRIGYNVNIQDNAVIHGTYKKHATTIGNNVSIGHSAIIHGCTILDNVLIGMGSIIMDGAIIGSNTIIGAGTVITQNKKVPSNSIFVGNPARMLEENISSEKIEIIKKTASNYINYAKWYRLD